MFDIYYSWDCRPSRDVRRPLWMPSDRATPMWSRLAVWPSGTSSLRSYSPTSVNKSANRSPCWQTLLKTYKGMGPHNAEILIVYWVKLLLSFILNVKRNVFSGFCCKPNTHVQYTGTVNVSYLDENTVRRYWWNAAST